MAEEEKKKEKQGKKAHKNKPTGKKYKMYKIEGNHITRKKICPRCGPGVFIAETKDRLYCGKCHYTDFIRK